MLQFSMTHTWDTTMASLASPHPPPRGICETHAREVKPLDHGLNLRRQRLFI